MNTEHYGSVFILRFVQEYRMDYAFYCETKKKSSSFADFLFQQFL